jgi:hypothetical protein
LGEEYGFLWNNREVKSINSSSNRTSVHTCCLCLWLTIFKNAKILIVLHGFTYCIFLLQYVSKTSCEPEDDLR